METIETLKKLNTTPHLCRSKVKQIEAKVRAAIREEVRIHPSKGKTLL